MVYYIYKILFFDNKYGSPRLYCCRVEVEEGDLKSLWLNFEYCEALKTVTLPKNVETLFSHSSKDNVIYMNTFSKTISPSFRIGYMILPKHLAAKYEQELSFMSCTVPTYIQYVVAELLGNGDFERHLNRIRRNKRKQNT